MHDPAVLDAFLAARSPAVLVRVAKAHGSVPRTSGTWMLVSAESALGTIGGGALEAAGLASARALLADPEASRSLDLPLGPDTAQCCGGFVQLQLTPIDAGLAEDLRSQSARARAELPEVLVLGSGHVGRALASALRPLPLRPLLIDSRADELAQAAPGIETECTPLPEARIRSAEPGSAYVVLTHDHGLDFMLTREALARGDAAYVGMIGSRTKRVRFERWLARGDDPPVNVPQLVCPIGAAGLGDKRPEVIAAFVAAEVLAALADRQNT